MLARLSAFVIWALIAATTVFWAFRLLVRAPPPPPHAVVLGDSSVGRGDLTRLFGAPPPPEVAAAAAAPAVSSRFRLVGIMAPKARSTGSGPQGGLALIAVDGKPPRAYAVGASLDSGLVLQSVSHRTAAIGPAQGPKAVVLEIPPLAGPATGTLPRGGPALTGQAVTPFPQTPMGQTPVPSMPGASPNGANGSGSIMRPSQMPGTSVMPAQPPAMTPPAMMPPVPNPDPGAISQ